ncbi:MAG: DUF4348 domain-containing protein [Prevotellaceae bacterium]|nr:DUF4348 domain-containing protein [Prevotellaceae bacterium]
MIKRAIHLSVLLAISGIAIVACKNAKTIQPENFKTFYQKFLTDERFQLSRIEFPLDGCETDSDTTIYWENEDDWTLLTGSIYDVDTTMYKVEKSYSPTKVELKIYIPDSGFSVTQQYELEDGKWYLVMYDSMSS